MLKRVAALWQDGSLTKTAMATLGQMISDAEYVFTHAWEACKGQAVLSETAEPLKGHDKAVNRGEREVRRLVVEHLALNPRQDVAGCLALVNMAKDAERVGDHGRNIFGVAATLGGPVNAFTFFGRLDQVQELVAQLFPRLRDAVLASDGDLAHEVISANQSIKDDTKQLQSDVFASDLPAQEAMATILLVRYLKRVNAHLGNIASGIIFPVENIDFISRGLKAEQQQ